MHVEVAEEDLTALDAARLGGLALGGRARRHERRRDRLLGEIAGPLVGAEESERDGGDVEAADQDECQKTQ